MGGLRNSNIAFKLFEALVIQPLLHNCASWIGITEKHIKDYKSFITVQIAFCLLFCLPQKMSSSSSGHFHPQQETEIFCHKKGICLIYLRIGHFVFYQTIHGHVEYPVLPACILCFFQRSYCPDLPRPILNCQLVQEISSKLKFFG